MAGEGLPEDQPFEVRYDEGAAVGYRWYDQKTLEPLFAFGHGLGYTRFVQQHLSARAVAGDLEVSFRVVNGGARAGKHVAQIYVSPLSTRWEAPKRLGAFAKVDLEPGASAERTVRVDPRLLAVYETARHAWHIAAGDYRVTLASSARDAGQSVTVRLPERWLAAGAAQSHAR
jgi:beta-glucosidase